MSRCLSGPLNSEQNVWSLGLSWKPPMMPWAMGTGNTQTGIVLSVDYMSVQTVFHIRQSTIYNVQIIPNNSKQHNPIASGIDESEVITNASMQP